MWTPRRILLLLAALFGVGLVYVGYTKFLGRFDGLPGLPAKFLEFDGSPVPELPAVESPTIARLREAFGDNCPEMGTAYPTRLEIRESGIVFAAGMPQIGTEPTKFVRLAPLSVATFGKPKPVHERLPGEVNEINTLHSDEGILEFDRPISSDRDMLTGKAKLIGIEFRSNPDPHNNDPRNGRIVMGSNQRSRDPGRFLVVKTPGPVHYRTADHPESANPQQPNVWTTAAVEIVNRDNLPRPLHAMSLPAVPVPSDDALAGGTVADMVLGLHTPPPTITANGLKLFMNRNEPSKVVKKGTPNSGGYSGIREMILSENVLFSLWIDGASGFPGSDAKPAKDKDIKVAFEPSQAHTALLGGGIDAKTASDRLKSKALLRIRTLGAFRYDMAKNTARFEIAPQPNPLLPNNVEVTRHLPAGAKDVLICQNLDIEFFGSVTEKAKTASNGPGFNKLTATGSYVLLAAATEQLQAQGTALIYESNPALRKTTTILHGAPLSAVRGKNILSAGRAGAPSALVMTSIDPAPGTKDEKISLLEINGPGRFDMFDEATGEPAQTATWTQSLNQVREIIGNTPLDKLTFTGDGQFADAKGSFRLKADVLKLWLKAGDKTASSAKPTPHMLHGLGHVDGFSEDAIIEKTDFLTVLFQDVPRPLAPSAIPPVVTAAPLQQPPPLLEPVKPTATTKAKPVKLSARKIDVTLLRLPPSPTPKLPVAGAPMEGQYELSEARCDDRVVVFQEPSDPKRFAVGLEIQSGILLLKKRANGHEMTVLGTKTDLAKVRFENTTISGPMVAIDQPNNRVAVDGAGWLRMPSSSGLSGTVTGGKSEITIHWQTRMKFIGEQRWAEFVGQVQAAQAPTDNVPAALSVTTSDIACHEMNVTFDRPIYFNQLKKKNDPNALQGDAKVQRVVCTPAAEDGEGVVKPATNMVLFKEETIDRVTKKTVKATQIEAKLLEVNVKDGVSFIDARGPGTTRILQMGEKETKPAGEVKAAVPAPVTATLTSNVKQEQEMKLTVVRFNGRLNLEDRKANFQKAVFRDTVRVIQTPSDQLNLVIDEFAAAPPRTMFLKCNDMLTVSTHKAKTTGGVESRTMQAEEAAEFKTDDYIGMGHRITFDGEKVQLDGYGDGQATLYRRKRSPDGQDYKSGNPLIYNTKTGQVSGAQSSGGQFTTPKGK